jgi:hypothetical protein
MKPRCAIVECYNRHDEVYLTTVHLLNRLGYHVDVFTSFRNRLKNSFVYTDSLDFELRLRFSGSRVLDPQAYRGYDLLVFNTFEGAAVLDAARRLIQGIPIIAFVHNASFLKRRPEYRYFLEHRRCRFAVLAPYVRDHIADVTDALYMFPVFFHDRPVPGGRPDDGRRRFCVQGYFDGSRRQYGALVDALASLRASGRGDFEALVMGRNFSLDFRSFHAEVERRGLSRFLRYAWTGIGYRSYYGLLSKVDFILPLVTPKSHPDYFAGKVTSSVSAAIGFGKLPVVDETLAACYGATAASFTYAESLAPAMQRALDASGDELASLRQRLASVREDCLRRSLEQMRRAVAELA